MKVVVVGTGFGAQVMAPAWASIGCEVEIVSPRETEVIRQALDAGADIVSIHSPPFLHVQHVMLALDRGVSVLCDKPFGCDANEAQSMLDRAQKLDAATFVNFELRYQPGRMKAKQLVEQGRIGDLQHVSLAMFGNGLRGHGYGWLADASLGGGWMGAYGAHGIDMLRWLTGSDVSRCGGISRIEIAQRPGRDGILHDCSAEDAFTAWFELTNGVTAAFDTGYSGSANLPERLILHGSSGALELVDDSVLILHGQHQIVERWEYPEVARKRYGPALGMWLPKMLDAIRGGRGDTPGFDDGLAVTKVLDRLKSSLARARTDRTVSQNEGRPAGEEST